MKFFANEEVTNTTRNQDLWTEFAEALKYIKHK